MKRGFLLLVVTSCLVGATPANSQTLWKNGRWFDGTTFVSREMYSDERGLLSADRPAKVRQTVDLNGGFVVPAYGDAHHHGIDRAEGLKPKINAFLRAGIFYVKNPNVIPDFLTPALRSQINRRDSIDVVFANGGITGSGGHPGPLHDHLAGRGIFAPLSAAQMPGRAYHVIDTLDQLTTAWPKVVQSKPDFIKVFLNGYERLLHGEGAGTKIGVSRPILHAIVRRAHAAGLRVTAHVDTAADVATAVSAGVDELGHMPTYVPNRGVSPDAYLISAPVAAEAARRGIVAIPTASVAHRMAGSRWTEAERRAFIDVHRANLAMLRKHGVKLAAGSDGISGEEPFVTAASEIRFLSENHLIDNLSLLRMWATTTPQTILPHRKVGHLRTGYEANFLVLEGNPIAEAANLHRIRLLVKAGNVLAVK
jgi:imidazolonepropionase-like amidohydrolase